MPPKKAHLAKTPGSSASTSKKRKLDPNAQKYYAVRAGKKPGIYLTWVEYKSFLSRADAEAFVEGRNPSTATDGTKQERYYAVAVGRDPGIYTDWESASLAIKGWKGPKYKRFDTREDAIEFIRAHGDETAQEMLREQEGDEEDEEEDEDEDDDDDIEPPAKKAKLGAATANTNIQCIYTDGSSRSNGRVGAAAGVGVYFGTGDPRNISEPLEGEVQTNQRAELTAILRAVEGVSVTQDIRIYSDSKYSISCVTEWYKSWEKNQWRTREGPVKNRDLVEAIRAKIEERDAAGTHTYFQWVKGHAADAGNVAADTLAVKGAMRK
ncbi:hypothetical protein SLS62_010076 [Diatrype stigma]|uniref:Ribonuclease H n=1 Tax=Diatrype stigma TaxID=117547 RepID=A0AAN9UIB8_9PEZI